MTEAFCVRCRNNVEIQKEKQVKLKNGKYAKKGICPVCGTRVFRIAKKEENSFTDILYVRIRQRNIRKRNIMEVMTMTQAYCVKCRAKVEMKDAESVTLKNGKPATKGICPKCGTKVFRIGKA